MDDLIAACLCLVFVLPAVAVLVAIVVSKIQASEKWKQLLVRIALHRSRWLSVAKPFSISKRYGDRLCLHAECSSCRTT